MNWTWRLEWNEEMEEEEASLRSFALLVKSGRFFFFFFFVVVVSSVYWIWCIDRGASRKKDERELHLRRLNKMTGEEEKEEAQAPKCAVGFVCSVIRSCSSLKTSGDTAQLRVGHRDSTLPPTSLPSAARQQPYKSTLNCKTLFDDYTTANIQKQKKKKKDGWRRSRCQSNCVSIDWNQGIRIGSSRIEFERISKHWMTWATSPPWPKMIEQTSGPASYLTIWKYRTRVEMWLTPPPPLPVKRKKL